MSCHVRGKREWTGDWSQKSDKWSDSVRAELGWSEKNDGTFWMTWQGEKRKCLTLTIRFREGARGGGGGVDFGKARGVLSVFMYLLICGWR